MSHTPLSFARWRPRGALSWILATVGAAWLLALAIALIYMVHREDYDGIGVLGFFALLFPSQVFTLALVTLAISWFAWRHRALLAAALFLATTVLALPMSLWPIIAMLQMASSQGVSVSIVESLFPNVTLGGPYRSKSIRYATVDGTNLMLDVWRTNVASVGKLHPAIIHVHGGAWIHGTRGELPAWNSWLNDRGYQVFDVEYRMPPPARWLDEVADVKCAIGWVAEHAADYQVDVHRISVMGYSAGGHLAMLAAYSMGDARLPPSCDVRKVAVRSVVNLYGPSDLPRGYHNGGSKRYVQDAMDKFIGGSPEAFPSRYRDITPLNYINAATPPTITLLGTSDRIVPVEQAEILEQALHAAGVEQETYLLPASDHGFDANWSGLSAQFARAKVEAFLRRTTE